MVVENGDNGVDSEKSDAMEIDEKGEGDAKGKDEKEDVKTGKPKENGAGESSKVVLVWTEGYKSELG